MPAGGSICPKRRTSAQREVPQAAHSLGAAKIAGVSGKVFGVAKYLQKAPCRDAESLRTSSYGQEEGRQRGNIKHVYGKN